MKTLQHYSIISPFHCQYHTVTELENSITIVCRKIVSVGPVNNKTNSSGLNAFYVCNCMHVTVSGLCNRFLLTCFLETDV